MKFTTSRLVPGGLLLFLSLSSVFALPAQAAIGDRYSLQSFKPYLERGHNTRLGWQGQPVKIDDPHLYFYSRESLALLAEHEFLFSQGQIHTQTMKVYAAAKGLDARQWRELEYFALEASAGRLDTATLHALVEKNCQNQWQIGALTVTFINEPKTLWLRISNRQSADARPIQDCLKGKLQKPHKS